MASNPAYPYVPGAGQPGAQQPYGGAGASLGQQAGYQGQPQQAASGYAQPGAVPGDYGQQGAVPAQQQQFAGGAQPGQYPGGAQTGQYAPDAAARAGAAPAPQGNTLATGHFGGHHVFQQPISFFIQDKTIHTGNLRDGTRVMLPDGRVVFETREKMMTLRNKEVVFDGAGRPFATLHRKTLSMHGTWELYRGESIDKKDLVAVIQPGMLDLVGKKIKVILAGQESPVFTVKGNFLGKSFTFTDAGGRVIAESKRQGKFASVSNFISGQDTFTLTVQPNVDTALLACVTMTIDNILEPGKKQGA